jgi:hypothetical protein
MLAHPHCPCTRASVGELASLMAQTTGKLRAFVLFVKPENAGDDWDESDLRKATEAVPDVTVILDRGGEEARRFGAKTSGHTLLFDRHGQRIFSGGITASRGHAGGNAGESAIVSLVKGHGAATNSTLVYGCGLTTPPDSTKSTVQ